MSENHKEQTVPGQCYEKALEILDQAPWESEAELCHGIARQTVPPHHMMGHAWVELYIDGCWLVLDHQSPNPIPLGLYYSVGGIDPRKVIRYSKLDGLTLAAENGDYGPWHPTIKAAKHF